MTGEKYAEIKWEGEKKGSENEREMPKREKKQERK